MAYCNLKKYDIKSAFYSPDNSFKNLLLKKSFAFKKYD